MLVRSGARFAHTLRHFVNNEGGGRVIEIGTGEQKIEMNESKRRGTFWR